MFAENDSHEGTYRNIIKLYKQDAIEVTEEHQEDLSKSYLQRRIDEGNHMREKLLLGSNPSQNSSLVSSLNEGIKVFSKIYDEKYGGGSSA